VLYLRFVLLLHCCRISFHSGFDFGYLLKILTASPLPAKEEDFLAQLQLYFPCIYDMKACASKRKLPRR